jgi:hypothetical protein
MIVALSSIKYRTSKKFSRRPNTVENDRVMRINIQININPNFLRTGITSVL